MGWEAGLCYHHLIQHDDAEALDDCRLQVVFEFEDVLLYVLLLLCSWDLGDPYALLLDLLFMIELSQLVDRDMGIWVPPLE